MAAPFSMRSTDGLLDGHVDGMELVVAGHLLDRLAVAFVFEDDEITHQIQEAALFEDAAQEHFQLDGVAVGQYLAGDGLPGHEAFLVGGEGADAGMHAI